MASKHHDDRGPTVIAANVVLVILSCSAVALRFLSRKLSGAGYWYDDWVIVAALPFALGINICNFIAVHNGFGQHEADLPSDALALYLEGLYFDEMIYNTALSLIKFSILLFYGRIFVVKRFRIALWMVGGVVLGWLISMNMVVIFQCSPIHKTWDVMTPGKCINIDAWFLGQAIPNIATDIFILSMPIPMIWKLQIPNTQKVALCGIFLLGGFVVVVSIVRLVTIIELPQKDITWKYVEPGLWSAVEPSMGLVSACLPTMRYLFKITVGKLTTSSSSAATGPKTHGSTGVWSRVREPVVNENSSFTRLKDAPNGADQYNASVFAHEVDGKQVGVSWEQHGIPLDAIHVRSDVEVQYD